MGRWTARGQFIGKTSESRWVQREKHDEQFLRYTAMNGKTYEQGRLVWKTSGKHGVQNDKMKHS